MTDRLPGNCLRLAVDAQVLEALFVDPRAWEGAQVNAILSLAEITLTIADILKLLAEKKGTFANKIAITGIEGISRGSNGDEGDLGPNRAPKVRRTTHRFRKLLVIGVQPCYAPRDRSIVW